MRELWFMNDNMQEIVEYEEKFDEDLIVIDEKNECSMALHSISFD